MHIAEGVLAAPVLAGGAVLAAAGTAIGLKFIDYDRIMTVALLGSAFFVASLIHIPIGPTSAHLLFNGLIGVILGWGAFPAILVALLLQALLFQFGGLTVLGVTTVNLALPAVLMGLLCRPWIARGGRAQAVAAFVGGAGGVLLAGLSTALVLIWSGEAFVPTAKLLFIAHLPVAAVEGVVTVVVVRFLAKVQPEMLPGLRVQEER